MEHTGYVQYGCGLTAPESWTNFDVSPTLRIQRVPLVGPLLARSGPQFPANVHYGDIVKGLPIAPGSCRAMYCSHVLEHLSLNDLRTALANTRRSLRDGGTFRFVLPDLEFLAREYLASTDEQPAMKFMVDSMLGAESRARRPVEILRGWIGNSRHLWMWDFRSLDVELRKAGFFEIRRAAMGDSGDPRFGDVEEVGRWENCLGIECRNRSA